MPERQEDNNGIWKYPMVFPGADLKLNPAAITLDRGLVESIGVDGRFLGAIRPFPGMADVTVHGIPKPSGSTTITSISNIIFAKYVAIQKGLSNTVLKGIAYLADNQAGTGKAVYFAYRDSDSGASNVVMLEDMVAWTDFELATVEQYDFTSLGKYMYASFAGTAGGIYGPFLDSSPPYNKAYFWDFKINSWDSFVTGFRGRFMSIFPQRVLSVHINADGPSGVLDSSDVMDNEVYSPAGTASDMPEGNYSYAVQLVSRKHGLRSYLRIYTNDPGPLAALRYRVAGVNPPLDYAGNVQQIRGNSNERTHIIEWGIPHFDGFRLFRSVLDDLGMPTAEYSPVSPLYEIDNYLEYGTFNSGSGAVSVEIDHDIDPVVLGDLSSTVFSDPGLLAQPQYDPFLDIFGPAPRLKRIAAYDDLIVGVTDVTEPSSYSHTIQENEKTPEAIVWSTLSKAEPENFPPENYYRLDNPAERVFALIRVSDHLFATTNAGIYRISRSGGALGINRLTTQIGALSRHGACGIGQSLFVVTSAGLKEVDANTGEIRSVTAFDRIILDDSEWAGSLANVFLEYDAKIGALVMLNTSRQECYILWESTGAITKTVDIPWTFLTAGPDVMTDGPQRVFFITSTGTVHVIDGSRQMGKRSMCGTTGSETANGTVTTSSATNVIDTGATFPANCVGFKVYITSGTHEGTSGTITARNSATNLSVSGLAGTLSVGDTFSVAPIYTRLTLPQLVGQGGDLDPFVRKTSNALCAAFSDLAGDSTDATHGKVKLGLKEHLTTLLSSKVAMSTTPDQVVVRCNVASTRLYPFLEWTGGNLDWELQAILVKGQQGKSEAQTRQG